MRCLRQPSSNPHFPVVPHTIPLTKAALSHHSKGDPRGRTKFQVFSPDGKVVRGRDSLLGVEIVTLLGFVLSIKLSQVAGMSIWLPWDSSMVQELIGWASGVITVHAPHEEFSEHNTGTREYGLTPKIM